MNWNVRSMPLIQSTKRVRTLRTESEVQPYVLAAVKGTVKLEKAFWVLPRGLGGKWTGTVEFCHSR